MRSEYALPLPRGWTKHVRSGLIHAISLASMALAVARSRRSSAGLRVELERANDEIALLKEELAIKDARGSRVRPRRRPHFRPTERMRILQLKAARRWSCEQAASVFMIEEQTLRSWVRRVDEEGESTLIRTSEPVNRYPDFVRCLVKQLKVLLPAMGKVRIAQMLARAGLHLGATTVGRILKENEPIPEPSAPVVPVTTRKIRVRHPNEVWHVDLTAVPTGFGFWVPWLPFTLPQAWPFCWWVAVVVDHASRALVGFAVFRDHPTSADVQGTLDRAIDRAGTAPATIISDKGRTFWCRLFRRWCRRRGIRLRFGAVGRQGSIAIVERFIRSLKNEYTGHVRIPMRIGSTRRALGAYATWYNEHRPHQALDGRTPREVFDGLEPAKAAPRFETRGRRPIGRLSLVVGSVDGLRYLPLIELRKVA